MRIISSLPIDKIVKKCRHLFNINYFGGAFYEPIIYLQTCNFSDKANAFIS